MRARLRVTLAVLLALSSIWAAQLALPLVVSACSCRPNQPDQVDWSGLPADAVVFVGQVTAMEQAGPGQDFGHRFGELRVDRLYRGTMPAVVRVKGGGGGDCTMHLSVAQSMITVAPYVDGVLTPMLCAPYGDPNTAEGKALIASAEEAFGPGVEPEVPPLDTDPQAMPDDHDPIGFVLGMTGILAFVIVVGILVGARRRGAPPG